MPALLARQQDWPQTPQASHALHLQLLLDQASSQSAKCRGIMLRGLQTRVPGTTMDAMFIAPLAVSRKGVPFWRALGRKRPLQSREHADQLGRLPKRVPEVAHPKESALPWQTSRAFFLSLPKHWHESQQTVQGLLQDPIDPPQCQDPHQEHDPPHNAVGSLDVTAARVPKWLLA